MRLRRAELVEDEELGLRVRRQHRLLREVGVGPEGRLDLHQEVGEVDVESRDALGRRRAPRGSRRRGASCRGRRARRGAAPPRPRDRRPRTRAPRARALVRLDVVVGEVLERAVAVALRDPGRVEPGARDRRAAADARVRELSPVGGVEHPARARRRSRRVPFPPPPSRSRPRAQFSATRLRSDPAAARTLEVLLQIVEARLPARPRLPAIDRRTRARRPGRPARPSRRSSPSCSANVSSRRIPESGSPSARLVRDLFDDQAASALELGDLAEHGRLGHSAQRW